MTSWRVIIDLTDSAGTSPAQLQRLENRIFYLRPETVQLDESRYVMVLSPDIETPVAAERYAVRRLRKAAEQEGLGGLAVTAVETILPGLKEWAISSGLVNPDDDGLDTAGV